MNSVAISAVPERRSRPQRSIRVPARVSILKGGALDALTIDLSMEGANLVSTTQLHPGQECLVEIGIGRAGLVRPLTIKAAVCYCIGTAPVRFQNGAVRFRTRAQFTGLSAEARRLIEAILT